MSPENLFFLILIVFGLIGSAIAGFIAYSFFKYSDEVRRGVFKDPWEK